MAQGNKKLGNRKAAVAAALKGKSKGSQKRQAVRAKKELSKGRKIFSPKGVKKEGEQTNVETTKAINKRNEALVAAKAVSAGSKFFLSDISEKGKREKMKQIQERNKKQRKSHSNVTEKLKDKLKKLEKEG